MFVIREKKSEKDREKMPFYERAYTKLALLTYLRLTNMPIGLPLNFNVSLLKTGILRYILTGDKKKDNAEVESRTRSAQRYGCRIASLERSSSQEKRRWPLMNREKTVLQLNRIPVQEGPSSLLLILLRKKRRSSAHSASHADLCVF